MAATPHITTIESALSWARNVLKGKTESATRDARLLLCAVLEVKIEFLIRYPHRALTVSQAAEFNQLVAKRVEGMPIAYLLGRQGFYDIEVSVTPDVLIPRPETELLVEKALAWAKDKYAYIVDVGTGSGAIALVLAKHLPKAHITGIDISPAALQVAQRNSDQLGLSKRIRWIQGDLLRPLVEKREHADLIAANLPYIDSDELKSLEVAKYEPLTALDGGQGGLEYIRRFLADVPTTLKPGGIVLMEIGANQGEAMRELVNNDFPALKLIAVEQDLAGLDRLVTVAHA